MSIITGYSENDMYYVSADCSQAPNDSPLKTSCQENQKAVETIIKNKNKTESTKEKYDNMKDLYNREVLHFFNMTVGIAGIMYYVYKNQDAVQNFFM